MQHCTTPMTHGLYNGIFPMAPRSGITSQSFSALVDLVDDLKVSSIVVHIFIFISYITLEPKDPKWVPEMQVAIP
jgi:hypothetical protein